MTLNQQFKLINKKPGSDFTEWNERMSRNYNQDHYYLKSHPFIVKVEKKRLETISSLIKEDLSKRNLKNPHILEVGCGAGHVLQEVSLKIDTDTLYGIDILDNWLNQAKEKLGEKATLIKGFAEDLPFEENKFDYVICSEVLEHVIDPKVVLNEIIRVVKKSGLIIITVPNELIINRIKDFFDSFRIYEKLFPGLEKHNDWHIHCYDLKMFFSLLPDTLTTIKTVTIPNKLLPLRYVIALTKK